MTLYDLVSWARITNLILSSVIVIILVYRGRLYWKAMEAPRRWGYIAFTLYAFGVAEYSFEALEKHLPIGARSGFFLAANLSVFYALWKYNQLFGKNAPAECPRCGAIIKQGETIVEDEA